MAKKITNYHCRLLAFIMSQVIVLNYLLLLTKPTTESISTRPQLNKRDDHTLHHTHNTSTFPIDIIIKWDDSISNHNQQQIKLGCSWNTCCKSDVARLHKTLEKFKNFVAAVFRYLLLLT
eukprot:633641_1